LAGDAVAPAARDAVIAAYYPSALAEAQAVRTRAQSAYTIASAVAAAIVAGGFFGDVDQQRLWVQVLGLVTLAAWLLTAGLFIHAIAGTVRPAVVGTQSGVDAFVNAAMDNASNERSTVVGRQGRAYGATVFSIVLTLGLIGVLLFVDPVPPDTKEGVFTFTTVGTAVVTRSCPSHEPTLSGAFDPAKLGGAFVTITAGKGQCDDAREVILRVPRVAIQSIASAP
jgi:hypothetical protein